MKGERTLSTGLIRASGRAIGVASAVILIVAALADRLESPRPCMRMPPELSQAWRVGRPSRLSTSMG